MSFGQTQFHLLLEKATSPSLTEPDWESTIKICEIVNEKRCDPEYALASIFTKLRHSNQLVSISGLQVLEAIVKNCGSHAMYSAVASKTFMEKLRELYKRNQNEIFLKKLKHLMQIWRIAFRGLPAYRNIQDTIELMTRDGVMFPVVAEADALLILDKPPEWSNEWACAQCSLEVGRFSRHHCRACGKVFCWKCSNKTAKLPQLGLDGNVRVCDSCFNEKTGNKIKYSSTNGTVLETLGTFLDDAQEEQMQLELAIAMSLSLPEDQDEEDKRERRDEETDGNSSSGDEENILDESDIVTMAEFRDMGYLRNSCPNQITVRRSHLLEDIVTLYKDSSMNLCLRPVIIFDGEHGLDAGAMTKEFFFSGFLALTTETMNGQPIFEGNENHWVPSKDANLLTNGTFESIGRFMVHAAIHTGTAFIGLSKAVSGYICLDNTSTTKLAITLSDVPDNEIQEAINTARKIGNNEEVFPEEIAELRSAAINVGFNTAVSAENASVLEDTLLYDHVIYARRRQLDDIKKAFMESPIWKFLQDRPYLVEGIFAQAEDFNVPAGVIISKIETEEENDETIEHFKEFIVKLGNGSVNGATMRQLVECWTGSPDIRGETLKVKTDDIPYIKVQACSNEIFLPKGLSRDELFKQLYVAVAYGSRGFGNETESWERLIESLNILSLLLNDNV